MNLTEYAKKHRVTKERIRQLVAMGRITAVKEGKEWFIPKNTPYPKTHVPWGLKKVRKK
jgi:hypothetical protein